VRKSSLTLLLVAALAVPSAAVAQSSTDEGYGSVGANVQTNIEPGGSGVGGETTSGTPSSANTPRTAVVDALPFTGADLLNLLAAGAVLVGLGLGLRLLLVRDRRTDSAAVSS
jgi:hypothetical protein